MGFNDAGAEKIIIDIETVASPQAAQFLDPVKAPANYKDPAKIESYCREEFDKRVATAALEADLCEVVAIGLWQHEQVHVLTRADHDEAQLLIWLWLGVGTRAIVGFNSLSFDLPVLIRRSQLLGVPYPDLNLDRYRTPHVDLLERLTFHGKLTYRSLGFYLRRFGLPHDDTTKGADVAALVAAEEWAALAAHCRSDVEGTAALARRLGWLPEMDEEAVA